MKCWSFNTFSMTEYFTPKRYAKAVLVFLHVLSAFPNTCFLTEETSRSLFGDEELFLSHWKSKLKRKNVLNSFFYIDEISGDRPMSDMGHGKPIDELDVQCHKYKQCQKCVRKEFGSVSTFPSHCCTWAPPLCANTVRVYTQKRSLFNPNGKNEQ